MNFELVLDSRMIYAPGQVKENTIGIDVGLRSEHPVLWEWFPTPLVGAALCPYTFGPNGITLSPAYWSDLDARLEHFPTMRFNVFLQYKRPETILGGASREWHLWNKPYFRFQIDQAQQVALEKLEGVAGEDALVSYASPCFASYDELWSFAASRSLIVNSNFARPSKVSGHDAYTYNEPGATGIAHSDPREIFGEPFDERFSRLYARHYDRPGGDYETDNHQFIYRTAKHVEEAASDSPLRDLFATLALRLDNEESVFGEQYPEVGVAFRRISLFCLITKLSWHIAV